MISSFHVAVIAPTHRAALPIPRLARPADILTPQGLRELIAGPLAASEFPLLDSRTRYWRYYLLIGPTPRWGPRTLGLKLLSIVRQNVDLDRARKGIGSRLYNRTRLDAGRTPTIRELRRLVSGFRAQYGAAVKRLWLAAQDDASYETLLKASYALRQESDMSGFFDRDMLALRDGHARSAIHRLLIKQSEAAAEVASVLQRAGSVSHALAKIKRSTLRSDKSKRLALAWTLLASLFRTSHSLAPGPVRRIAKDEAEDEDIGDQASLARVAAQLLFGCDHGLDAVTHKRLADLIAEALKCEPFVPPLAVAARDYDGTRQRLFADLRLSSFHRLLEATK